MLEEIDADILKIASFDVGNLPFINRIAKSKKPVVMSIGGGKEDQIRSSVEILLKYHNKIAILHCVSEYPCEYNRLGLNNIETLIRDYPQCVIGSSDHFNGILSGPIAYLKGARVFEKHVTLNRAWQGTDHSFALEPDGFRKFVRDITRVPYMLPTKPDIEIGDEPVFKRLGKSIIALVDILPDDIITMEKLSGCIFNTQYIPVRQSNLVIGSIAKRKISKGEPITFADIEMKQKETIKRS